VVPLYKRGDKKKVGNYRGISLLYTAYKIHAEMLRNRLEERGRRERYDTRKPDSEKADQRLTIFGC